MALLRLGLCFGCSLIYLPALSFYGSFDLWEESCHVLWTALQRGPSGKELRPSANNHVSDLGSMLSTPIRQLQHQLTAWLQPGKLLPDSWCSDTVWGKYLLFQTINLGEGLLRTSIPSGFVTSGKVLDVTQSCRGALECKLHLKVGLYLKQGNWVSLLWFQSVDKLPCHFWLSQPVGTEGPFTQGQSSRESLSYGPEEHSL